MNSRRELLDRMAPYHGSFLHAVVRDDPVAQNNLRVSGQLFSPDWAAVVGDGLWAVHQSLRDVPIIDLARSAPSGVYSPFAGWRLWAAAIVRNGGRVGIGELHTAWLASSEAADIVHAGDVELALEEARRKINPDAASRLASLYLAEDSLRGRKHLESMFGTSQRDIMRVRIPSAIRVTRCDTTWFERYFDSGGDENLTRYWVGEVADPKSPKWEFLVEGMIEKTSP